MPYIAQVALRHKPELVIFGGDYPTKDGTGIYIFFFLYNIKNLLFKYFIKMHLFLYRYT